ncbi:MAG: APC family permease, partial [Vicinamibacterales bacterium]
IGIGPFITIPLLMTAMGGPPALLGWVVALVIVLADGLVWSELGAAMPRSGGSFGYLLEAFGRQTFGRLMAFLFVWQFLLSGPLEIASGYIGFARYLRYLWTGMTPAGAAVAVVAIGLLNVALLYRRIGSIATITVALWAGTILATVVVIATGAVHFSPARAFDVAPGSLDLSLGFVAGLGAATRVGIYDYLGYYNVCYIGDEVDRPGRVIPRSIVISTVAVAILYLAINLSIVGVVPWREFVPASDHPQSDFIVSVFMERVYGTTAARAFTALILWTAFASVFALLLGYSRVPFAAAREGYFFAAFARVHRTGGFPHVSLVTLGLLAVAASFAPLGVVIDALIATRILVQFMGQIAGLVLLRRTRPDLPRPFRMWLYPLPAAVAFAGWVFVLATTGGAIIGFGLAALAAGVVVFLAWSWRIGQWPFGQNRPHGV